MADSEKADNHQAEPVPAPPSQELYAIMQGSDGRTYLLPLLPADSTSPSVPEEEDQMYNYASNLCHWVLHLLQLDDTAKEGDLRRLVVNCKYSLVFFFSHSKLSKYLVENLDFLLKTQHLLSPQLSLRVLESSFINMSGGAGRNVEADLVQEHSVRNRKRPDPEAGRQQD